MKKKILLLLFAILLAAPVGYAEFFYFTAPEPHLNAPKNPYRVNKEAYKPYPAPRGEVPMERYRGEMQQQFNSMTNAFKDTKKEYEKATNTIDTATREFDEMAFSPLF